MSAQTELALALKGERAKTVNEIGPGPEGIFFMYRVLDKARARSVGDDEYDPDRPDVDLMWFLTQDLKRVAPRTVLKARPATWRYLAVLPRTQRQISRIVELDDGSILIRRGFGTKEVREIC